MSGIRDLASALEAYNKAEEAAEIAKRAAYRDADNRYYETMRAVNQSVDREVKRLKGETNED